MNSVDPDQIRPRHKVGPNLNTNCLNILKKVDFEKKQITIKCMQNYPVGRVNLLLTLAEMKSSCLTINVDSDQTAPIRAA